MKITYKILVVWLSLAVMGSVWQPAISAQALLPTPTITFNSFTGTYHLSRDVQGRSLLTTEEVILANFPANGSFSGITRTIPKFYQNQNVNVKVLHVRDAAGNNIPFKTTTDKKDNIVLATGNPAITIYGPQTFRISYQTRDVINLSTPQNQFLLNVNGRGWDQGFNQVSAAVHIPKSFSSSLSSKPTCYIGYLNSTSYNCSVTSQAMPSETLVTSKALGPLSAHQALIVKLEFKPTTFSRVNDYWDNKRLAIAGTVILVLSLASFWYAKRRHKT